MPPCQGAPRGDGFSCPESHSRKISMPSPWESYVPESRNDPSWRPASKIHTISIADGEGFRAIYRILVGGHSPITVESCTEIVEEVPEYRDSGILQVRA